MEEDLLTALEVSKIIGVSYKTTLKYIKDGVIPHIIRKNSKKIDVFMVSRKKLDVYMESKIPTLPHINDTPKRAYTKDKQGIVEDLRKRIVELELLQTHFLEEIRVKNQQIKDFTGIVEKLQITNQYLLIEGTKGTLTPTTSPGDTIEVEPIEVEDPQKTPTPERVSKKQELVDMIQKKVKKGWGDKQISKWMNKKGIETLTGKGEWFPKTIYRLRTGKG